MKNQNKSIGVALKVFHKKSDLQNYEGTYYLHKKGSIYPDTYNNVCSVYEAKKRLAKTFLLDIKNVEAYITKDNIHLYYEFMSDEDLEKCEQCEQEDYILESGVCSVCDKMNRKNDYLQNDGTITIAEDNIHLYYEFMSDEDLKKHIDILKPMFQDRWNKLNQVFGGQTITAETLFNDNTMLPDSVFGVKDTLKPIDEYIAEIKASEEYQAYISSKLA